MVWKHCFQNNEMSNLKRELEKHKELLSSSTVKAKWAENKMKAEADQHKVRQTVRLTLSFLCHHLIDFDISQVLYVI